LGFVNRKVVFAVTPNKVFSLAARNLKNVAVENIRNINIYQVFRADKIVTTAEALNSLKIQLN
jgi:large subunit ribosomal protein L4